MKFDVTETFAREFRQLPVAHRRIFTGLIPEFNKACEEHVANPGNFVWPARLRVSRMTSVKDGWEMTWSFTGPDGRATFRFMHVDGETRIEWRRIGRHEIFKNP